MRPLAENILGATSVPSYPLFVVEEDDPASLAEVTSVSLAGLADSCVNGRKHNWAGALNSGYEVFASRNFTHIFTGADDLHFSDGWDKPVRQFVPDSRAASTASRRARVCSDASRSSSASVWLSPSCSLPCSPPSDSLG
jgi:hypothetical protein